MYSGVVLAQGNEVSIKGQILDENNNPIPGAIIVFNDKVGDFIETVKTDTEGAYQAIIPPGTYSITADGPDGANFISTTFDNREILSEETIHFRLTQALPDQNSPTSSTNVVFYALIVAVILGIGGFGSFLLLKMRRGK